MADLIELLIKLSGDKEVINSLEKVDNLKKALQKEKINLQIEKNKDLDKEIVRVRQEIHDLQQLAKAGIISDTDKARLKDLQSELDQLRINAANSSNQIGEITNGINAATTVQKELTEEARQQAAAEAEAAAQVDAMAQAAERAESRFQAVLNVIDGIATAISGAASLIGGVNSFGQGIWDTIEGAGGLFSTSLIDRALDTVISQTVQRASDNLDKAIERYDIMSTFTDYMTLMGISPEDADASLARINQSILGLPIGLDEAAYRLRRYQMFMGDLGQATNFTIGIQRAILAGGANEQMRSQAYNQIERLLSTGELTNKRQWISLMTGLGVSSQFIAEQLGYEGWGGKELAAALYSNKISVEEFLGAITDLGKGTSEAAQHLNAALEIQKGTVQAWLANIDFAFTRGNANTLGALNTMLTVETGVSVTGYMEAFRDKINEAYIEIQEWIYSHPESFEVTFDALDSLGNSLSKFNLGEIAAGALDHAATFIEGISGAINTLDTERTESFVAFAASVAKPIATIAKQSGDFGVAMGVVEEFEDHDWGRIFEKLAESVNNIADVVSALLDAVPNEMLDDILVFSVTTGPLLVTVLNSIATALKGVGTGLAYLFENPWLGYLLAPVAGVGLGALLTKLGGYYGAEAMSSLYDIDLLNTGNAESDDISSRIAQRQAIYAKAIEALDSQSGRMQSSLERIRELNDAAIGGDKEAMIALSANVDRFNALFPDYALNLDRTTGLLDKNSRAALRNADAYVQAYERETKGDLLQNRLAEIDEDIESAKAQFKKQQELAAVAKSYFDNQYEIAAGAAAFDHDEMLPLSRYGYKYLLGDVEFLRQQYNEADEKAVALKAQVQELNDERTEVLAELMYGYLGPEAAVQYRSAVNAISRSSKSNQALLDAKTRRDYAASVTDYYAKRLQKTLDEYNIGRNARSLTWDDQNWLFERNLGEEFERDLRSFLEFKDQLPGLYNEYIALEEQQSQYSDSTEEAEQAVADLTDRLFEAMGIANDAADAQDNMAESSARAAEALAQQTQAVEELVASYSELRQASYDAMHTALSSFEEIKPPDKDYDFVGAVTANAQLAEEYNQAAVGFANEMLRLRDEGVVDGNLVNFINDIRKTGDMHKLVQAWEQYQSGGLEGLADLYGASLTSASNAADVNAFMDALQSDDMSTLLAVITGDIPIPEGLGSNLIDSLNEAIDMYEQLIDYGYDPEQGFLKMLNPKEEEQAYDYLDEFHQAMEDLFGIGEDADEDTANGIWGYLNKSIQETVEEQIPNLVDALDKAKKPVQDFDGEVESVAKNQEEASSKTDDHTQSVGELQSAVQEALPHVMSISSEYATLAANANSAAEAVAALSEAVQAVPSISWSFDIPSIPSATPSVAPSFFASGGLVDGNYIGKDNVPAMLMPGEFVVRRKAAQLLGKNFLQNLNSMNIPAAVDALMRGVNLPMAHGIVAYDNRRYSDNHATINQNIVTNNPAFTYRRASRFVGAL